VGFPPVALCGKEAGVSEDHTPLAIPNEDGLERVFFFFFSFRSSGVYVTLRGEDFK